MKASPRQRPTTTELGQFEYRGWEVRLLHREQRDPAGEATGTYYSVCWAAIKDPNAPVSETNQQLGGWLQYNPPVNKLHGPIERGHAEQLMRIEAMQTIDYVENQGTSTISNEFRHRGYAVKIWSKEFTTIAPWIPREEEKRIKEIVWTARPELIGDQRESLGNALRWSVNGEETMTQEEAIAQVKAKAIAKINSLAGGR